MFMATCFCAYVRKMKELEILPQLSFSAEDVQEQNFQNVKTLIHAISPTQYTKEQSIKEDIIINHGELEDDNQPYSPEEEEIFHLPFFYK